MSKVHFEVASKEVDTWLDFKKISAKKREEKRDSIESMVDAVSEGILTLNDDKVFVHTLKFPLKGEGEDIGVSKLEYKPRIGTDVIQAQLQNVKSTDLVGITHGCIAAITGQVKGVVKKLDTEDYQVASCIANFFL